MIRSYALVINCSITLTYTRANCKNIESYDMFECLLHSESRGVKINVTLFKIRRYERTELIINSCKTVNKLSQGLYFFLGTKLEVRIFSNKSRGQFACGFDGGSKKSEMDIHQYFPFCPPPFVSVWVYIVCLYMRTLSEKSG
mmetsp:Transcript_1014/g.1056  ORF Transcript_1014/g.1056 Transcript_1014/m.1056 type:complete len:142 (+) Transcript_1014:712-1137(+)